MPRVRLRIPAAPTLAPKRPATVQSGQHQASKARPKEAPHFEARPKEAPHFEARPKEAPHRNTLRPQTINSTTSAKEAVREVMRRLQQDSGSPQLAQVKRILQQYDAEEKKSQQGSAEDPLPSNLESKIPKKGIALFIGSGNMTLPMIETFMRNNPDYTIYVCSPNAKSKTLPGGVIACTPDELEPNFKPDAIVIGLKPQNFDSDLPYFKKFTEEAKIVISIAAGKTTDTIAEILDVPVDKVVRVMPNTPMTVKDEKNGNMGVFGICGHDPDLTKFTQNALGGTSATVPEKHMHAVTAMSGSGPAFFARALANFAESLRTQAVANKEHVQSEIDYEQKVAKIALKSCQEIYQASLASSKEPISLLEEALSKEPLYKPIESITNMLSDTDFIIRSIVKKYDKEPKEVQMRAVKTGFLIFVKNFLEAGKQFEEKDFDYETIQKLIFSTALGTCALAIKEKNNKSLEEIILSVTSKGGTTYHGMRALDHSMYDPNLPHSKGAMNFQIATRLCLRFAHQRSADLSKPAPKNPQSQDNVEEKAPDQKERSTDLSKPAPKNPQSQDTVEEKAPDQKERSTALSKPAPKNLQSQDTLGKKAPNQAKVHLGKNRFAALVLDDQNKMPGGRRRR